MTNLNRTTQNFGIDNSSHAESPADTPSPLSKMDFPEIGPDSTPRLTIISPSRLHFGLLEVCASQPRLFGGIGAMIDQPSTRISLHVHERGRSEGNSRSIQNWFVDADEPWKTRMESVVRRWLVLNPTEELPRFHIRLDVPPPMHAGLGSGTQIACATASLIHRWLGNKEPMRLEMLVHVTQRGKRSYVGLAGHQQGGFIVDHGIDQALQVVVESPEEQSYSAAKIVSPNARVLIEQESLRPLRRVERFAMPSQWHAVLAQPLSTTKISGIVENDYFGQSQSPNAHREIMWNAIQDEILPALREESLTRFGAALYEYGRDAGRVFAKVQGGIYRDQVVTSLIEWGHSMGVLATGQTSWGPTVYAILPTQSEAKDFCVQLERQFSTNVKTLVTAFNNSGYRTDPAT